jgi:hypothetical protein
MVEWVWPVPKALMERRGRTGVRQDLEVRVGQVATVDPAEQVDRAGTSRSSYQTINRYLRG